MLNQEIAKQVNTEQRAEKYYQTLSRLFEFELKFIYYLLGVAIAVLGFSVVSTKDIGYLPFWGIWSGAITLIALSVLMGLWAIKMRNEVLKLLFYHTLCVSKLDDLIKKLDQVGGDQDTDTLKNRMDELEREHKEVVMKAKNTNQKLEKATARSFTYYHAQTTLLLIGVVVYFLWHVVTLYSKGAFGEIAIPCPGSFCLSLL